MSELGTIEELPKDYVTALTDLNVGPLWPSLRAFLPFGQPDRETVPTFWRYQDIRPLLLQAGELTPIEKAERRVLMLCNPGLGLENAQATPSIYLGYQLILPGEVAPNHRHTPSAIRFVVEGEGGYTTVEGEKLPMERGDLILTPSGLWHEHGHTGSGPVIWLDALDLPLVYRMEASYAVEGPPQSPKNIPDSSQRLYRRAGLTPYKALDRNRSKYPLLRYPWKEVRQNLLDLASGSGPGEAVHLAYINPETGDECLPILGFSALMLRPGEEVAPARRSCSAVLHAIEGRGQTEVDGATFDWAEHDTVAVPTYANFKIRNGSSKEPAFLFMVDDAPMQRKLGFYEEFS
ncbi:MAG: cupin domain-containing protein [Rhodospirillales bacterium]|nr:cupin domain-containing protein [Rhodospirillales bacterium]